MQIKEGDEWKAAFRTNQGLFEPTIMFFRLCNSPMTFQTMMNDILQDFIHNGKVICYMDDILVYTPSPITGGSSIKSCPPSGSRGYFSSQRNASLSRRRLNTLDWSSQKTMWLWIRQRSVELQNGQPQPRSRRSSPSLAL